mmetsp:Transcript_48184/g.92109  ORF Transcript_48184/g.92109 Transcript_48184/m.92109 type:complete len:137 (-) Transcript_48184:451-861(-)
MAVQGGPSEQQIVQHFQNMRQELQQLWSKIGELEMERQEHVLVLNAISPLEPSRKCFRLIGGILVERTVGEVLPAVQRNRDGIQQVVGKLTEQMDLKKKELAEFQAKFNIRVKGDEGDSESGAASSSNAKQGVLVS